MNTNTIPYTLQNQEIFPHPVSGFKILETHISWVLLTGEYAYKIKKPVNFGFLDYSSLEKRHHFCLEELRLNQRLAPDLYLEVVAITGNPAAPTINAETEAFEYAVKMREFPQSAQLDRVKLSTDHIDQLAQKLAAFHQQIPQAAADSPWGDAAKIYEPMLENFTQIREIKLADEQSLLEIETWTNSEYQKLIPVLQARKQAGFIRECHGDMHLANMVLLNNVVVIFDGIEFNPYLRWIDVISELAFTLMDLQDRNHYDLATQLLNSYLEITGDYAGLEVLRFYQVYRAMVRAKVTAIELTQRHLEKFKQLFESYINLAKRYIKPSPPVLMITHGVSGSGKSTIVKAILKKNQAICLRSDIERKRLFGMDALERSTSIYNSEASEATYKHLAKLAEQILNSGFTTIIDATFLSKNQRSRFHKLAEKLEIPFKILNCQASSEICEQRIKQRKQDNQDPSDATVSVLKEQLESAEALTIEEQEWAVTLTGDANEITDFVAMIKN